MFVRFSIHQINAPSSLSYLSKFCCRKREYGCAKVIHEKKERIEKKWTQSVRDIENNGYLDARLEKKERRKKERDE